MHNTRFG